MNIFDVINSRERAIEQIQSYPPLLVEESDEGLLDGSITTKMIENGTLEKITGFSVRAITAIVEAITPFTDQARRRGPRPKSKLSDHLVCYLYLMKAGMDMALLSTTIGLTETRFTGNVDRIRPLLNHALRVKWKNVLPRHNPDHQRSFPHAALLIDCTTVRCNRPMGNFEEGKLFYDAKNHIYGLKKEVAVTAAPPHFYVASSPFSPGKIHDYSIHKTYHHNYDFYLRKTIDEKDHFQADRAHTHWAVIADMAYIGPQSDTPNERRIYPVKKPISVADRTHNETLNPARVPVEQFFGRLYKKFGVFCSTYRYDHFTFDIDFDNGCLLINEDIADRALADEDEKFYKQVLTARLEAYHRQVAKEKEARARYKRNKRLRSESVQSYVHDP